VKVILPDEERQFIRDGLARLGLHSLAEYHDSVFWMAKRTGYGKRHPHRCRCAATSNLKLHHKTYKRLGNEQDADLEFLCGRCHEREHARWSKRTLRGKNDDRFKKWPEYRAYRKVQRLTERFNALLRRRVILWLTANAANEK
jgi:5-methylcytosine-specific restriction endonuclease McrA